MARHPDVLIVGGGVIGLTTAYFLAKAKCRVEIVDQSDFGQEASWAGAGILCPRNGSPDAHPFEKLHARSVAMFPELSNGLRDETGIDNGYMVCGGLEFNISDDESEWSGRGDCREWWNESVCRERLPELGDGLGPARWLPGVAQLRNPRHLKALVAANRKLGVKLSPYTPVYQLMREGDRIAGVKTPGGVKTAGQILLTTGAWTALLLDQLDCRVAVKPIRGQIVLLQNQAPLIEPVLFSGARYVVPRPDGLVLVGSTEEDVGFVKRTTAAAAMELTQFATRLVPKLAQAHVERMWAGLRPGSPDGMPFLGLVPGCENLFVAAGHFRSGIQLSPGTALVMKELLLGETPSLSLNAFRQNR